MSHEYDERKKDRPDRSEVENVINQRIDYPKKYTLFGWCVAHIYFIIIRMNAAIFRLVNFVLFLDDSYQSKKYGNIVSITHIFRYIGEGKRCKTRQHVIYNGLLT